jgi:hypothetical protein
VQEWTFQYFYNGSEPNSKLACERINLNGVYPTNNQHVITSGGTGHFGGHQVGLHHPAAGV